MWDGQLLCGLIQSGVTLVVLGISKVIGCETVGMLKTLNFFHKEINVKNKLRLLVLPHNCEHSLVFSSQSFQDLSLSLSLSLSVFSFNSNT